MKKHWRERLKMDRKYLITGGCGFIGTALIKRLLDENPLCKIRVMDNLSVGKLTDLKEVCTYEVQKLSNLSSVGDGVTFVKGDIRNLSQAIAATVDVDVVIHLAANSGVPQSIENPVFDMEENAVGTFNMLEGAKQNAVEHFVFASSSAIAGTTAPPMHEDMVARPISPYGASKLAGEGYCSVYAHAYGVKTSMLRFGNVYGPCPLHKTSVVAKFIKQALEGEKCVIYGDGNQTRDFIFINDLLDAVLLASRIEIGGEVFQIATSKERTVGEMANLLSKALADYGVNMKVEYGDKRKGDVVRNYSDTRKAERVLGWKSKTELEEGLLIAAKYFCYKD